MPAIRISDLAVVLVREFAPRCGRRAGDIEIRISGQRPGEKLYEELVESKAALLDSEVRYRRLFETAKDGILILDTGTGRIADANPYMSELLGYSHEQFLGKAIWERRFTVAEGVEHASG